VAVFENHQPVTAADKVTNVDDKNYSLALPVGWN
jgi:hypothetical protein